MDFLLVVSLPPVVTAQSGGGLELGLTLPGAAFPVGTPSEPHPGLGTSMGPKYGLL